MPMMLHRRGVLSAGLAALSLATLGGGSAQAQAARLRMLWWGSQERADRTNKAIAAYKQVKPDLDIAGEFAGWSDYWPRLATQVAGRNAPDLIQMDYRYLFEYARRNQLEPPDDYIGKGLDLSAFNPTFPDSGKVDGKLYAVPWTQNSVTCHCDGTKLKELGIPIPESSWTWDDLKRVAGEVKKAGITDYWGVSDKGRWEPMMEFFMRQRGKALYNEDGGLGFEEADVAVAIDQPAPGALPFMRVQLESRSAAFVVARTLLDDRPRIFVDEGQLNAGIIGIAPRNLTGSEAEIVGRRLAAALRAD